ncbi:hypothetical protein [Halorubellus litoreus]|uniref:Uncharacterized protein n=1 Tax=Halorubellus litoreus TaxID=755308 RepID=A0ABD5VI66_9EURY
MTLDVGQVTSVFSDNGGVECNVKLYDAKQTDLPRVSVLRLSAGLAVTPQQRDDVAVDYLSDGRPVIVGVLTHDPAGGSFPTLTGDEFALVFGDGTKLTVTNNGGSYAVEIDANEVTLGDTTGNPAGAITDVTTTTDVDGHVTSVNLVRSTKVNIE